MRNFSKMIQPYVTEEFRRSESCLRQNDPLRAFNHLESAHVLGQESTYFHVLAHVRMAQWAICQKKPREFFGQILRIFGALTKTFIGLVPSGNTGGANISPFKSLPLSLEHQRIISNAKMGVSMK